MRGVDSVRERGGEGAPQWEGVGHRATALPGAESGSDDRLLAGLGVFGEMVLHAGLDAAAAGLNIRTRPLDIRLTGPNHRHAAQHGLLAGLREGGEMLFDAGPEPALTGV